VNPARPPRVKSAVDRFDVAVIGSGMGGWAGVRAARRRGRRVALFEAGLVGGT
jgi:pyruvate/2-oxoglutarate dehydrogenase complex dihydrolipoamide dehydrogenase (E3) component